MNEQGAFIASLLDSARKAYAAGAVLRVREAGPEEAELVEAWGFAGLVEDTQVRIEHLAEALACGRPELFALDAEWLGATYAARGLPLDRLRATLRALQEELDESLPEDAAPVARAYLEAALGRLADPVAAAPSLLAALGPASGLARTFLSAVLEGRRGEAERVIFDALDAGTSVVDLHLEVIAPVQAELGRMWQTGEIHVAEEHFGSRVVEDVLALLRARTRAGDGGGRCVLTASVSGNLHDIGARIVGDHFEMSGWRSIFLGANVPAADLVQAVQDFGPDLVALSVGLPVNVRATAATIEALRAAFPRTPVLVGGWPFALVEDLWRDVGADGCARDAASAVAQGERLVGRAG